MLDILIALAVFGLGYWLGKKERPDRAQPPAVEARELERLREDRAAFTQLMGYTADPAYGLRQE